LTIEKFKPNAGRHAVFQTPPSSDLAIVIVVVVAVTVVAAVI
jgi:hypothetical protein